MLCLWKRFYLSASTQWLHSTTISNWRPGVVQLLSFIILSGQDIWAKVDHYYYSFKCDKIKSQLCFIIYLCIFLAPQKKKMYILNFNFLEYKINFIYMTTVQLNLARLAFITLLFFSLTRLPLTEAKQSLASSPLTGKWPNIQESLVRAERRSAPR